ncbi:MAG TPA: amino acid permease, partial [Candidatus Acidoferrales bacterium]|nr:amino acid permease [Candidatus Acidoferrales bacterium]
MAEKAQPVAASSGALGLVKGLGLFDSTMIVVGSMIGSGIYIVSADISNQVQSPGLLIIVWVMSGVMTLIGALSYGELAAAMPHAGGQYVYLRESFGELWGFLYGWTMLLVVQTATIAAVAIAFAKFTGVFAPWFSPTAWILKFGTFGPWRLPFGILGPYDLGLNRQNLLAIISIVLLTWINLRGLRLGKIVQNVFTSVKTVSLAALVIVGFLFARAEAVAANFHNFWYNAGLSVQHAYPPGVGTWEISTVTVVGVAMVGSLFASDAWYDITFTAS